MPQKSSEEQTFSYQTRLQLESEASTILGACAHLFGHVERELFSDVARGQKAGALKSTYLRQHGITARHFNAIRIKLEGKIASIKELQKERLKDIKGQITALKNTIAKLPKDKRFILHQKRRRLAMMESRLHALETQISLGKVPLCFGSRRLFRAQFDLKANQYETHEDWLNDWKNARNSSFFLLGSKDETAGNQSCSASMQEDGSITLRLRLPPALISNSKYLTIKNIKFAYGHDKIQAALQQNLSKKQCVAISCLFRKDEKGWRLHLSLPQAPLKPTTKQGIGCIGMDINSDHLAVVETDRFGNPLKSKRIPLILYGKTKNQTKAIIGNAVKEIIQWSLRTEKPLAIEKLNFQDKKMQLHEMKNASYARMLSSFAYNAIIQQIKSRAFRFGVQIQEVNPAYTSIIGRVKFAKRYGLSIHSSAALVIGRRVLKFSERLPRHSGLIPDGKGNHVTLSLPVRNRGKHVWSLWRQVKKKIPAVLAAHFRTMKNRSLSQPIAASCDPISDFIGATPIRESSVALLD